MGFGLTNDIPWLLYVSGIVSLLLTLFWRPIVGLYYLLPLIVLQTVRYRMNEYPLAQSVVPLMLLAIIFGQIRRGEPVIPNTGMTKFLGVFAGYTLLSLFLGSFSIGVSLPFPGDPRFGVWLDYMTMPAFMLLTAAIAPSDRHRKMFVLIMCLTALLIGRNYWSVMQGRDLSTYSDTLRESGGFGYAGVNGLAAFLAQFAVLLLALAAYERRLLLKLFYWAQSIFLTVCLMFTFSRGAYAALVVGFLFIGLAKQRSLLVFLLIFAICGTALVPGAVRERVLMTKSDSGGVDHSSELRFQIWEDALSLLMNPYTLVMGMGFNTYAYLHRVGGYEDTHNIYLKVILETGVIGLVLFLLMFFKFFRTGLRISRTSSDPFRASIGLGVAGWIVCAFIACCFGDRWMYLQISGYLWVLTGLISSPSASTSVGEGEEDDAEEELLEEDPEADQIVETSALAC